MKGLKQSDNPFNPQFGLKPDIFIGRADIISEFTNSIGILNDPNRSTIITGLRGSGKTSLLSDIAELLGSKPNVVVDVTAKPGMLNDILGEVFRKTRGPKNSVKAIKAIGASALGFSFSITKGAETQEYGFRHALTELLEEARDDAAVVFLIDEINNDTSEVREFATTYQHLVRERRNVALLMAGLPQEVYAVLNDQVLTFLRRAHRVHLGNLPIAEVESTYREVFARRYGSIQDRFVKEIATKSLGYPYLVQLIGYYLWGAQAEKLSKALVEKVLDLSMRELFKNVHELVFRELSEKDKEFITAMLEDSLESKFADIVERLGVTKGYASKYRERLLHAGIVYSSGYGRLAFSLPFTKEYLQQFDEG